MKRILFALPVALLAIGLLLVGCQKDQPIAPQTSTSTTSPPSLGNGGPGGLAGPGGTDISLSGVVDNDDGTWTWTWVVCKANAATNISHVDIRPGDCFDSTAYVSGSATNGTTTVQGVWQTDPSLSSCSLNDVLVLKFDVGTDNTNPCDTITVTVNQDFSVGDMNWIVKGGCGFGGPCDPRHGQNVQCAELTVGDGIGCYKIGGNVSNVDCFGNSTPVDGATVSIADGPSTPTDGSGNYLFNNVPTGCYDVSVAGSGYAPALTTVCVPPSDVHVDFVNSDIDNGRCITECEPEDIFATFCGFSKGGYNGHSLSSGGPSRLLADYFANSGAPIVYVHVVSGAARTYSDAQSVYSSMPPNTRGGRDLNARQQGLAMLCNVALGTQIDPNNALSLSTDVSVFGSLCANNVLDDGDVTIGDLINLAAAGNIAAGDCLSKIIQLIEGCRPFVVGQTTCP